ncbi:MAG TPA: hypothetical protein VES42_07175 [Pilimelia sp.]|nr:hypothetical protein [Pilimelia sp.]
MGLGVVLALPASAAAGDTHFFLDNRQFFPGPVEVFQSTRAASGAFAPQVNVTAQAGTLNEKMQDIAAARIGRNQHLVVARGTDLLHTVQGTDGTWSPFATIATGQALTVLEVAAVNVASQLQVVIRTLGAKIYHAVRNSRGVWSPFVNIESQAGALNPGFGPEIHHIAAAGFSNGRLQLVVDWDDKFMHTIRGTDGTWSPWENVTRQTGRPGSGSVFGMTAAEADNMMHLVVHGRGGPFHAVRALNGTWSSLTNVFGQTGSPGTLKEMAATEGPVSGDLLLAVAVCCVPGHQDRLLFLTRKPNGTWSGFRQIPSPPGGASGVDNLAVVAE